MHGTYTPTWCRVVTKPPDKETSPNKDVWPASPRRLGPGPPQRGIFLVSGAPKTKSQINSLRRAGGSGQARLSPEATMITLTRISKALVRTIQTLISKALSIAPN